MDHDDKVTLKAVEDTRAWMEKLPIGEKKFIQAPRNNLAACYNHMATYSTGDILMYAADDISFETKAWDEVVRDEFLSSIDRIWLMWGYDPARKDQFPDHGFMSRWARNILRYVFPVFPVDPKIPGSQGIAYTDIWIKEVYRHLGRLKHLPQIEIRHNHWTTSEEFDDNYVRHAVMQKFHITPEFAARSKQIPDHAERLKKFLRWWNTTLKKPKLPAFVEAEMNPYMPDGWHEKWRQENAEHSRKGKPRKGSPGGDRGRVSAGASKVDGRRRRNKATAG